MASPRDETTANEEFLELIRQNRPLNEIETALKVSGVNVNYESAVGETALRLAVVNTNRGIIKLLRENDTDINRQNRNGDTALHLAVEKEDVKIVEFLLENYAHVDIKNEKGETVVDVINKKLKEKTTEKRKQIGKLLMERKRYIAKGLQQSLHGDMFQVKLFMLFAKRAKDNQYAPYLSSNPFWLSSDWDAAGSFDDVCFEHPYRDETTGEMTKKVHFYQAKHKLNVKKHEISESELINSTDFGISKYFLSFIGIKNDKHFEDGHLEFSIVTNTHFSDGLLKRLPNEKIISPVSDEEFKSDKILYFESDELFQFKAQKYKLNKSSKELSNAMKFSLLNRALKSKQIDEYSTAKTLLELKKWALFWEMEKSNSFKAIEALKKIKPNRKKNKKNNTDIGAVCKQLLDFLKPIILDKKLLKKLENGREYRECEIYNETNQIFEKLRKSPSELLEYKRLNSDGLKQDLEGVQNVLNTKTPDTCFFDSAIIEAAIDDSKFNEYKDTFFHEFHFVTKFPNEDELGKLIGKELGDREEFNTIDIEFVNASFFVKTLDYLKSKITPPDFLTNQTMSGLFNDIKNQMNSLHIVGCTKDYVEKLEDYNICFANESPSLDAFLGGFLSEQNQENQVFYLFSREPKLSAIKMVQILKMDPTYEKQDSYIFTDLQSFSSKRSQMRYLNAFGREECHKLLIIEMKKQNSENELCEVLDKLSKNREKKIILIKKKPANDVDDNIQFQDDKNICFEHLTHLSQTELLLRVEVNFQGSNDLKRKQRTSKLNELIDEHCAAEVFSQPHHLTRLLDTRELFIGDRSAIESWAYVPDYYINREFHRQKIDPKVLEMKNQLFFITGATKANLNALGVSDDRILQWQDIENDDEKINQFKHGIILNDSEQHDAQIFHQFDVDVHWLQFIESKQIFLWMGCKGQIKKEFTAQIDKDYTPNDQAELFNEHYFCFEEGSAQKVVLIANEAGMGKSLMLIDLARQMKRLKKMEVDGGNSITNDKWIIRINLNDFARSESPNLNEVKSESAIDFFVDEMAIPGGEINVDIDMQRRLLKFCLANGNESAFKIIIMLDGFDEVCPDFRDATTRLIKVLKNSEVAQIYVTTRIHQKDHLEQELQTPAFNLKPWVEKYQTEFLRKFWKWSLMHEMDLNNRQIKAKSNKDIREYLVTVKNAQQENENYKDELVQSISAILGKCSDEEIKSAIGNQINFTEFIKAFFKGWNNVINDRDKRFVSIPLLLRMLSEIIIENKFTLPADQGLSSLYDAFIRIKFEIFSCDKAKIVQGSTSAKPFEKSFHQKMHKMHKALAVRLFFPEHVKDLPNLGCLDDLNDETNSENAKEEREELAKVGLLTLNGNELRFIHRSFAEYFVSRYLIDHLRNKRVQVLLIDKILPNEEYHLIHKFFNDQIEKELINEFQFDFQLEAKMILFMKRADIFKRVIDGSYCGICKLLLKSIRHDKELHKIIMTKKRVSEDFNYVVLSYELLDILLDELLLLDDKTIYEKCIGFAYVGRPSDVIIENQQNKVIVHFIKRLENENRLNSGIMKRALVEHNVGSGIFVRIIPIIALQINVSAIVMILEHSKWPANVRKELMLTPNREGRNILSQMAKRVHIDEEFKIEQAREIAQKLFENIDDSDEKYFEDLAIISIDETRAVCFDKLLEIVAFNSKFHKKLNDVFDVSVDVKQKKRALVDAIKNGELERVRDILKLNSDAKKLVLLGNGQATALYLAIDYNRIEIIEEIFNSLAEEKQFLKQLILWPSRYHETVLQLAAKKGYTDIVRLLLEKSSEDRDLLKELLTLRNYGKKKAIELAYDNNHLEIVGIILRFAIDNCVEIIDDLVENMRGMQTAAECLKSTEYLGRLFDLNPQYEQIYNLFQAVRENGTNVPDLLDEIRGNDDTIEKLLLNKDLERNSFFALSIQKGNEDALNFIRDFLREHIYFGYDYLLSDALTAKTFNTQIAIFHWVKENLENNYTFPGEKIFSLVVCAQLEIANKNKEFETFLSILEWAKDKKIFETNDFRKEILYYLGCLAENWENAFVPPTMDLILDICEGHHNKLYSEMLSDYVYYERIFNEMENYPINTPEDKRVDVSNRLKSILNEMANSVWQADGVSSVREIVNDRRRLENLKKFMEKFYSGENDKAAILAKIKDFLAFHRHKKRLH